MTACNSGDWLQLGVLLLLCLHVHEVPARTLDAYSLLDHHVLLVVDDEVFEFVRVDLLACFALCSPVDVLLTGTTTCRVLLALT